MMGEETPAIAEAIADSRARKIRIPLSQENVGLVGIRPASLPELVDKRIEDHLRFLNATLCKENHHV